MPNFTAVEVQICVYTGFVEYAKNEEKLTEAPAKNVKMKNLSLSVYKMILLRFGVWVPKVEGNYKNCVILRRNHGAYAQHGMVCQLSWLHYSLPSVLIFKNEKGNVQIFM